jgi:hypothetical protein
MSLQSFYVSGLAVIITTFWAAFTLPFAADHLEEVSVYSI